MVNHNIEEIAQAPKGETTSDDIVKANVIREIIFKQSDLLAVGTDVIPERTFSSLDVDFSYPGEIEGDYPVAENSTVDRERVVWNDFDLELKQAEARFMVTDIAQLREQDNLQNEMSMQRAAEAIAEKKDHNIIRTLHNGAGTSATTLNRGSDQGWDQSSGDPEADIVEGWNKIFAQSNVNESDSENTYVIAPASAFGELNSLQLINNVQQQVRSYIEESYGIEIRFSRFLDSMGDAIVAVGGNQTAIHGVLESDDIQEVEQERVMGRGEDTLVRQFFNTAMVEDEGLDEDSYRVNIIENVVA